MFFASLCFCLLIFPLLFRRLPCSSVELFSLFYLLLVCVCVCFIFLELFTIRSLDNFVRKISFSILMSFGFFLNPDLLSVKTICRIILAGCLMCFLSCHSLCRLSFENLTNFMLQKIIPFHEVTCVRKAKTAGIFPNAIEILAGSRKYFFASFLSRDEAFKLINDGLLQHGTIAKAITDQQDSKSESGSQDNGIIDNEQVNSSSPVNGLDSIERNEDTPVFQDSKLLLNGEDVIVSETLSEVQDYIEEDTEAAFNTATLSSSFGKTLWKQEDSEAPKVPEYYTKVAESKFPIKAEEFFTLFFSDDAVDFVESYHGICGDKDFRCTSWCPHEKFGHVRDVSFRHPIKIYFGARFGSCEEVQKFRVYRNSHLVIETSQEISDAPYSDYFRVEGLWDVEKDGAESTDCCILRVYVNVAFCKKTIWRGKIEQATAEECREAFAIWINNAHELLKQRELEKQEESPKANMIQNGQVHGEMQRESGELSERLPEAHDHLRIPQTVSGFRDANQGVGNSTQGNLIEANSTGSLFRKFMARLCSSMKTQNQISVVLVITFAMILLLMQLSIVVLLSRPQQVHVIQADYMSTVGSGAGDRVPDTAAWLERQILHLKDEMLMVESRLEKMRQEHSMLKAQLKDLEKLRKQRW
ncbi:protein VASCULAR ASSOCIATED DEATH 1, chloroplastic isoform X2 [Malania oleifera]|uniref:protein VASCULAR ASSOCIATED DEATH 1, chloroplastic isoform X2 n=1 Tax=Malania oleifera TaxID=397392 RepID=UPI0025AE967D|nr:protein VASCULAR ASSOCIATED DEATH 1, chloroplastic isoform X2 [Malania oleifera]